MPRLISKTFLLFIYWDNYTPLHFCAQSGFVEGAKLLISHGASINIQSRKRETPLLIAVQYDQFDMVKYLIEIHAEIQKSSIGVNFCFFIMFSLISLSNSFIFC